MAKTVELEQSDEVEKKWHTSRNVLIGRRVLHALGKPADLLRVQVKHLWDQHYRVNVFVGPDAGSAHVANSYFVETDDDGTIIAAAPRLQRQYGGVVDGSDLLSTGPPARG
jgi:hypothetical protein